MPSRAAGLAGAESAGSFATAPGDAAIVSAMPTIDGPQRIVCIAVSSTT